VVGACVGRMVVDGSPSVNRPTWFLPSREFTGGVKGEDYG